MTKPDVTSPLSEAIRAANQERSKQVSQHASLPESQPRNTGAAELVSLSIRVDKRNRLHWLIEARKSGTNLTEAITEALTERFGESPL